MIARGPIPSRHDARWLQLAVLCTYAIVAREIFHFERTHLTAALCVAWAMLLDAAIGALLYRKILFPLTPAIVGLASSLLLDARTPLPYLCAVTLAIASKAIITAGGRHLFNPACFGVVVMLQLAPGWVTGMPSLFGGYLAPSLVFAALGIITVVYARQSPVSLSFVAGFLVFGLARAALLHSSVRVVLGPSLGPAFLLFSFHMISDPSTTPRTVRVRVAFGLAVALLDAAFRLLQIPNGSFYSLFIVCALNPWIRNWESALAEEGRTGRRFLVA